MMLGEYPPTNAAPELSLPYDVLASFSNEV
jgi:hypothetical protein